MRAFPAAYRLIRGITGLVSQVSCVMRVVANHGQARSRRSMRLEEHRYYSPMLAR